jgi:hypothetical protein
MSDVLRKRRCTALTVFTKSLTSLMSDVGGSHPSTGDFNKPVLSGAKPPDATCAVESARPPTARCTSLS